MYAWRWFRWRLRGRPATIDYNLTVTRMSGVAGAQGPFTASHDPHMWQAERNVYPWRKPSYLNAVQIGFAGSVHEAVKAGETWVERQIEADLDG